MKRRDFIKLSITTTLTTGCSLFFKKNNKPFLNHNLRTDLYGTIGIVGGLSVNGMANLVLLDLKSKKIINSKIPLRSAHLAKRMKSGHWLAIPSGDNKAQLCDEKGQVIKTLKIPTPWSYSGHGVEIPEKNLLLLTSRNYQNYLGQVHVFDLISHKYIQSIDGYGTGTHDIHYDTKNKLVYFSNYGYLWRAYPNDNLYPEHENISLEKKRPSMVVLNDNLEFKNQYFTHTYGAHSHFHILSDGSLVLSLFAFKPMNKNNLDLWIKNQGVELSEYEISKKLVIPNLPTLHLSFDKNSFISKEIIFKGLNRRPQSLIYHPDIQDIFSTFIYSNSLLRYSPLTGQATTIDMSRYKLNGVRGVCHIPKTPYIAVTGYDHGLVILNARTFELVEYFDLPTHSASHIQHSHS